MQPAAFCNQLLLGETSTERMVIDKAVTRI